MVELGRGEYGEVMAHRFYFRDAETEAGLPETSYDRVIERIIASLEAIEP